MGKPSIGENIMFAFFIIIYDKYLLYAFLFYSKFADLHDTVTSDEDKKFLNYLHAVRMEKRENGEKENALPFIITNNRKLKEFIMTGMTPTSLTTNNRVGLLVANCYWNNSIPPLSYTSQSPFFLYFGLKKIIYLI